MDKPIEQRLEIIPLQGFPKERGKTLNKKAICFWVATGFFAKNDSFWKEVKWNELDFKQVIWQHKPRKISFDQAVQEFADLLHQTVKQQIGDKKPLLALSGGLDSRTLAVALKVLNITPCTYSYRFANSFDETSYGKAIAHTYNWDFKELVIPPGYLWSKLEEAGKTNLCYAEFTHARQLAVADELSKYGDIWLLGHWGDVLFDDMGVSSSLNEEGQLAIIKKKILKKGGYELAKDLWSHWQLEGTFEKYLSQLLKEMLSGLDIVDANARIRAFKSLFWATRWTSTNLSFFSKHLPIALPYYANSMCQLVMSLPEKHLAARQIQIEYIKRYSPELAKIPWQAKAPYNLYTYHKHRTKAHLPYRIKNKLNRIWQEKILQQPLIQRNWEIQFLGQENDQQLQGYLFSSTKSELDIPPHLITKYYQNFKKKDPIYWSHPISMLLTLRLFEKLNLTKA